MADLRSALETLFSSNVVVHNVGGDDVKVVDTSSIQTISRSHMNNRRGGRGGPKNGGSQMGSSGFGGLYGAGEGGGEQSRYHLYHDYELMDRDAIVSAALDFYADESVVENEHGEMLTINTDHGEVERILHNLFYDVLNVEFNLRSWIRDMVKYGDCFIHLNIDYESSERLGVYNVQTLSPYHVDRVEGQDPANPYDVWFEYDGPEAKEEELGYWEVGHFSLRDSQHAPYGKSVLENARKTWKRLCLHEESRVWTESGHKQIKNIESGDTVYSFDPDNEEVMETKVKDCRRMADQDTYNVSTRHRDVKATDRHGLLVYNKSEKYHYKAVENLKVDEDYLVLPNIEIDDFELQKVKSVDLFEENSATYDLEVENDLHNFVVDGVVSHNTMMEDAMLIHRIMRAPERRIFKIDVGNLEPKAVESFMNRTMQELKKQPLVDPDTGEYDLQFNLMNMMDDYYMPVRGRDDGTEISTLNSLSWNGIEDIEYLRQKLMSALRVPNAFLGYERDIEGKCIALDTEIPTLSGETKTAEDIVNHYQDNEDPEPIFTYSYDEETGKIVAGEVETAEITREDTKVVDVELDNGEVVTTTPDHKFMTRDGNWVEAQNLDEGNSLMPLYRGETDKKGMKGYETVYHPSERKFQPTHRAIAEQHDLYEDHGGSVVHHEDFDKHNNRPDNLDCSMNFWEHRELHEEHANDVLNSDEAIEERINDPGWLEAMKKAGKKGGEASAERLSNFAEGREPPNKNGETLECQECGDKFYVPGYRRDTANYCGYSCSIKGNDAMMKTAKSSKVGSISKEDLLEAADGKSSFAKLERNLGITRRTLNSLIEKLDISKDELVEEHIDPSYQFMNTYEKNHEVKSVTVREEKIDTCDIQVKEYKNFATEAGVIVHNSTLAQESIKFANQVQHIQKIIASELTKIGIIHLFSQGIRDERLVDFELGLTHPSQFVEQQKVDLLDSKFNLARTIEDQNLHSTDWIMKNIFNMSEDDIDRERRLKMDDWKREFVKEQLTREGNNPIKTGQSFGTPGDLADSGASELKAFDFEGEDNEDVPSEEDEGYSLSPDNPFKDGDTEPSDSDFKTTQGDVTQNYQGGSPLAAAEERLNRHRELITETFEEDMEDDEQTKEELEDTLEDIDWMNEDAILEEDI